MAVNTASKYAKQVDERFVLKSLTEAAINQSYEWDGVKTVTVYDIPTAPMNNYIRTGLARYGTAAELDNTVSNYTLSRDRSFTFTIDRGNHNETQMVMNSGRALARQLDEVVIPELDIYRIAAMSAAAVTNGHTATAAVTASNAYSTLLNANAALHDDKVPMQGRIVFVTPGYYNFLKLDNNFLSANDIAQQKKINGQIGEVDGVKVVMVPTSYMPVSTAFVLAHPSATVSPKKLEDYKTHDNPPGINGWLVEGRQIYDAFVLKSKINALYAHKIV